MGYLAPPFAGETKRTFTAVRCFPNSNTPTGGHRATRALRQASLTVFPDDGGRIDGSVGNHWAHPVILIA